MRLFLFGSIRIEFQNNTTILSGNSAELLGLIALGTIQKRAVTRSKLAGTLFPNVSEEQARKLLTNAIYRLKRDIGPAVAHLSIQGDCFDLHQTWIDVIEFNRLLKTAVSPYVREALALFKADFLDDVYSDWVLAPRVTYREKFLSSIGETVALLLEEKNHTQALQFAHHWCQVDPLDEYAHLALMKTYCALGRFGAAVQQYNNLKAILNEELGIEPTTEIQAFLSNVRAEREANSVLVPQSATQFIGRQLERKAILGPVENLLEGQGSLILLGGEPGIGKTRLLQEVEKAADWRGIKVVWGQADERETKRPFQHITTAFQNALQGPRRDRVLAELSPITVKTLMPVIPNLKEPRNLTKQRYQNNPYKNNPSLNLAIRQLIMLLTKHQPQLMIFDDIQWADHAFWELLPILAKLTTEHPLSIVLSYRPSEMRESKEGWPMLLELDKSFQLRRLHLEGLSPQESLELANTVGFHPSDPEMGMLYAETGGNPLMIRELAENQDLKVSKLFSSRLKKLPEPSFYALQAASVLGRRFSYSHWLDTVNKEFLLEPILKQQFIKETEHGYEFKHDLLRSHIYQTIGKQDKKRFHERAMAVLEQANFPDAELGYHAKKAECWDKAAFYFKNATTISLQMGDYENARAYNKMIHSLLPLSSLNEGQKLPFNLLDIQLKHTENWSSETEVEAFEIFEKAKRLGDLETLHGIILERIKHTAVQGKFEEFDELTEEAIAIALELQDIPAEIITLNDIAYKLATFRQKADKALEIGNQALELADSNGQDPYLVVTSLFTVVYINFKIHEPESAKLHLRRAEQIFEENQHLATLSERLLNLQAFDAQHSGDIEKAREINNKLIEINRQSGDQMRLQAALFSSCALARKLGQLDEAILYAEELVQMVSQNSHNKDEYQTFFYRAQLADCLLANRDCITAEEVLAPLIKWVKEDDQMGHSAMYGSIVIGILYIYQGNFEQAIQMFKWVVERVESKGSLTYVPLLCLAESYALNGNVGEGVEAFERVKTLIKFNVPKNDAVYYYLIEFLLYQTPSSLSKARDMMIQVAYSYSQHQFRLD